MADIERILKNFNTEVPRLEALGLHQSEGSVTNIQDAMLFEHQSVNERTPSKRTVVLRLDGPNGILAYECELEVARLVSDLRQKWNSLLLRRLRNPGKPTQQQDEVNSISTSDITSFSDLAMLKGLPLVLPTDGTLFILEIIMQWIAKCTVLFH